MDSVAAQSSTILKIVRFKFDTGRTDAGDGRNIEIKARVGSDEEFQRRLEIAKKLTNSSSGQLLVQRDVFFNTKDGRFKLRYVQPPNKSQLVYYKRPDVAGPKLTKYSQTEVDNPEVLEKILSRTNGVRGELGKERHLFIYDRTRIHLDKVENLGNFVEFEVCLRPDETIEEGRDVAVKLMKEFDIKNEDLMQNAYFDELNKK